MALSSKNKDYFTGQSTEACAFLSSRPEKFGNKDAEVVIRIQSGDKVWVEHLVAPAGDVQGASLELLKAYAKAKKRSDSKKSSGMLINRLASNLRASPTASPKTPTAASHGETMRSAPKKPLPSTPGSVGSGVGGGGGKLCFGQPLDDVMARERQVRPDALVPKVVRDGISYIFRKGLGCEGIFRLSGAKGEVDALRNAYDNGEEVDLNTVKDPNVVASLLKLYVRELPEPLLVSKDYDAYIGAVQLENDEAILNRLAELLQSVPENNRAVLTEFVVLLSCVSKNSKFNKMVTANCSIVLGPNILRKANIDMSDLRHTAAMAMESQDVNRVSEYLINHPAIVTDGSPEEKHSSPYAMFETKLVGHSKSVLAVVDMGDVVCSIDSAGGGNTWRVSTLSHVLYFDTGGRPIGAVGGFEKCWIYGQKGVDVRDASGTQLFSRPNPFFCATVVGSTMWLGTEKQILVFDGTNYAECGRAVVECELLFNLCWVEQTNEVWGAGLDNSLCIYDASSFELKHTIRQATRKRVNQMIVSDDGTKILTASEDGNIAVFSLESRECVHVVKAHESRCNYICWVRGTIWSCSWDTTIHIYDAQLNHLDTLSGYHDDAVFSLCNTADYVWSSSGDKGLVVWRLKD